MVTRAMTRTVALLTTTGVVFGCCEVPHEVIHWPPPVVAAPSAAKAAPVAAVVTMVATAASEAIAFDKVLLIMVTFPRVLTHCANA
jgi:hypothetical protein